MSIHRAHGFINHNNFYYVVGASLLIGRGFINLLDPQGYKEKRPIFKRFFTVTLPDNGPLALLSLMNRVSKSVALRDLPALFIAGLVSVQLVGTARWITACCIDKLGSAEAQCIASIFGPRDFYAGTEYVESD